MVHPAIARLPLKGCNEQHMRVQHHLLMSPTKPLHPFSQEQNRTESSRVEVIVEMKAEVRAEVRAERGESSCKDIEESTGRAEMRAQVRA